MTLNIQHNNQSHFTNNNNNVSFRGPLDAPIAQALNIIETNQMVNSTAIDLFAMVIPRTAIDTKKRNKYAGFETFFRELTGTVIMCLSAGTVAYGVAAVHNKLQDKDIHISPKMWVTDSSFDTLKQSWDKSDKSVNKYVKNVLSGLSGLDGRETVHWNDIKWDKKDLWYDDASWKNIKWKDSKWANAAEKAKSPEGVVNLLSDLILDKNAHPHDVKKVSGIIEHRIGNALQVSNSVDVDVDGKKLSASLKNLIRDTHDLGKNVFTVLTSNADILRAEKKLKSMNKTKSIVGVSIVAAIGLVNQYVNRAITRKRTGNDEFVGDSNYGQKPDKSDNKKSLRLPALKALASVGMLGLSLGVMKIKSPKDFMKRLEFKELITSGNAIKTLYTATLIGRFTASRNETELRESCTRDYLAFMNWLVLGSFVSKGVAQVLFDKKQNNLFNVKEDGSKGIKKWLNNVSLKSPAELAAKGEKFASKNILKHNIAYSAGLLYSGLALGCAIPLLNILITKHSEKNSQSKALKNNDNILN